MATRHQITNNGSPFLPVSSQTTTYNSAALGADADKMDVYVQFFNASGAVVTPTAGTVNVYGSPFQGQYLLADNSPITASQVNAGIAGYTPATIYGLCDSVQVVFSGITGATSAKAVIYKRS